MRRRFVPQLRGYSGYAPADVRLIGLEFDTGSAGTYTAATIHLDTVSY